MDRRQFLMGVSGLTVGLAGCTGDADESDAGGTDGPTAVQTTDHGTDDVTETRTQSDTGSELPAPETLLDRHYEALSGMAFVSEERFEPGYPDSPVVENDIRSDGDETLLEGTDAAQTFQDPDGKETVWFSGNARINRQNHAYNPDGFTPWYIQRVTVTSIFDIAAFEAADAASEGVRAFEATSADEAAAEDLDVDIRSVDVRVTIAEAGYLRSLEAELIAADTPESDETRTTSYHYEITNTGDVTVSAPEFVDYVPRIEGSITADNSAIRLEHTGGPSIPTDEGIGARDADGTVPSPDGSTFPEPFEPGDTAYVYWSAMHEDDYDEVSISMGDEPASVAREFVFPDDENSRGVVVRGRAIMSFFEVYLVQGA